MPVWDGFAIVPPAHRTNGLAIEGSHLPLLLVAKNVTDCFHFQPLVGTAEGHLARTATMQRSLSSPTARILSAGLILILATSTGCVHTLLATGIYLWQGGNVVPAECEALEGQRVVVICRPPSSHEYRHAGAARNIGKQVSLFLKENVSGIDIVSPTEVDNWIDEQDWDNFKELGRAVKATRIVYIELDHFELYKGSTLYQGNAEVALTVYDVTDHNNELWARKIGQVLFPHNSGIPAADKPVQEFQRQFIEIVSQKVAQHFYRHNPNAAFALDAVANK